MKHRHPNLVINPQRLRLARADKMVKVFDLAHFVGITHQMIPLYERGGRTPMPKNLIAISQCLDVSVEWLIDPEPILIGP